MFPTLCGCVYRAVLCNGPQHHVLECRLFVSFTRFSEVTDKTTSYKRDLDYCNENGVDRGYVLLDGNDK